MSAASLILLRLVMITMPTYATHLRGKITHVLKTPNPGAVSISPSSAKARRALATV
jgi:hypothetical protein